jgi:CRISPR/Cas system-associated protein Cas5 (RAMP superfamily)
MKPESYDAVNPQHYKLGKTEVIDFIEEQELNFHRATALKYIVRAGKKNTLTEVEDLEKALWYIKREIKRIQKRAKFFASKKEDKL